jgi:hypothetical protein
VAQFGAVLGREFAYALLRAVTPLEEPTLQQSVAQLVEAELLYQRGHPPQATDLFKHYLGELAPGHAHLEQGATLYDSQQHRALAFSTFQNSGVACRGFASQTLWYLGFPDQALAQSQVGISLAQDVAPLLPGVCAV